MLSLFCIFWILSVLLTNAIVGTGNIFPRHLMQILPAFAIFLSYILSNIKGKSMFLNLLLTILIVVVLIPSDLRIVAKPPTASLPKEDKYQFFEDWTSGYGFLETAIYIKNKKNSNSRFITDDKWLAHGLDLFFGVNRSIEINQNLFFLPETIGFSSKKTTHQNEYLILNRLTPVPASWPVQKVWTYNTPPRKPIDIYIVNPTNSML